MSSNGQKFTEIESREGGVSKTKNLLLESDSIRGGIGFPPFVLRQDLWGFRRRGGSGVIYEGKLDSIESEYEGGEREAGHPGLIPSASSFRFLFNCQPRH